MKNLLMISIAAVMAACSTIGQLTVKDYRAKSGERVMAGQGEPKSDYKCEKLSEDKQDWGLKGNMNRAAAMERVTSAAVESAPAKGANYAYIIAPSEVDVGIVNVNAFRDAKVAYYKCANLPPEK